jgi:hypothetical protein
MTWRALLLALGAWALLAAPAGAATVQFDGTTVTITAGPAEPNVVDVSADTREGFSIRDPSAPLTAGPGCSGPPEGPIVCVSDLRGVSVRVDLGDGDDRVSATLPESIPMHASGGPGDDELDGGDGPDVLQGGPGDDVLDGGVGRDAADYRDHADGIVVDVTSPGPAGSPGERDTLTSIAGVWGGAGDDRIRAPGAYSRCGAGEDRLTPAGDSGLRAADDCELLAFSRRLAVERGVRLDGRSVRFVVWGSASSARVQLRVGRTAITRRVVLDYGGRRGVTVRLPARAAARLRRGGALRLAASGKTLALRVTR